MVKKIFTTEWIIGKLRETEVLLTQEIWRAAYRLGAALGVDTNNG